MVSSRYYASLEGLKWANVVCLK